MTVTDQIERTLDEVIGCAYPSSVDKLCTRYILELSEIVKDAAPSDLKTLIANYQTVSHRDPMAYRKR